MIPALLPTPRSVAALAVLAAAAAVALLAGAPLEVVAPAVLGLLALGLAAAAADLWTAWRAWRAHPLVVTRTLPHALAVGVPKALTVGLSNPGSRAWTVSVYDGVDGTLATTGLPQTVTVPPGRHTDLHYTATPRQRGGVSFGTTRLRVRTPWGLFELLREGAQAQSLQVYPNFAAVARYAWLAGDRRLAQIGIKTYTQRGAGTDFKQLADYRVGDAIRHIDWKATLKRQRPIVREFQDERDQSVIFLLDCGRRMRADEGLDSSDGSHFDQALNAVMLMTYVALKEGDEVGALTFGNPEGEQRRFAPRKGTATLNALMARLHDIQPSGAHSDYILAAQDLLRFHRKRALVIVLTNFRDEDAAELAPSIKLMRSRHLVLLASLRERALREVAEQPLVQPRHAVEAAGAHHFEQSRRDAFARVTGADALSVDVEPSELAVALVNRYHAVKRAGLL